MRVRGRVTDGANATGINACIFQGGTLIQAPSHAADGNVRGGPAAPCWWGYGGRKPASTTNNPHGAPKGDRGEDVPSLGQMALLLRDPDFTTAQRRSPDAINQKSATTLDGGWSVKLSGAHGSHGLSSLGGGAAEDHADMVARWP